MVVEGERSSSKTANDAASQKSSFRVRASLTVSRERKIGTRRVLVECFMQVLLLSEE